MKLPYQMTDEICQYLEDLRASGETNMYGAAPYIERDCSLTKKTASTFLQFWMKNYQQLIDDGHMKKNEE